MPPEEIRTYLHAQPFAPFRIYLTDGRHLDITHPELVLLGRRVMTVGFLETGTAEPFVERTMVVALVRVGSVEPLGQTTGQQ